MCVLSWLEVPFHFPLGSLPGPAAAAAPLLHWSSAELAPALEQIEGRKRRLQGAEEEQRGLGVKGGAEGCRQKH